MNDSIQLKAARLPKMLGELTHSNQYLKVFSVTSLGTAGLTLVVLIMLVTKPPVVLTLAPTGEALQSVSAPKVEDEISAAVSRYVELRYNWEPGNVKQQLEKASAFILPASSAAYKGAAANIVKFSSEKVVSQHVYPSKPVVDLTKKTVMITGDRITAIQGLKAAGNLRLELTFDTGPRTQENPWGLYVVKEREEM